jgi:hypothetical protein
MMAAHPYHCRFIFGLIVSHVLLALSFFWWPAPVLPYLSAHVPWGTCLLKCLAAPTLALAPAVVPSHVSIQLRNGARSTRRCSSSPPPPPPPFRRVLRTAALLLGHPHAAGHKSAAGAAPLPSKTPSATKRGKRR